MATLPGAHQTRACTGLRACCIMTVLSPSNVTSTSMSLFSGPILLAARKPCPPHASRHACRTSAHLPHAASRARLAHVLHACRTPGRRVAGRGTPRQPAPLRRSDLVCAGQRRAHSMPGSARRQGEQGRRGAGRRGEQTCRISTRDQVAPAFRPELITWTALPSCGRLRMYSACARAQQQASARRREPEAPLRAAGVSARRSRAWAPRRSQVRAARRYVGCTPRCSRRSTASVARLAASKGELVDGSRTRPSRRGRACTQGAHRSRSAWTTALASSHMTSWPPQQLIKPLLLPAT